jgi:hypothetical protein
MPGSFAWGDVYGGTGPGRDAAPGDVSPPVSQAASGKASGTTNSPAWSWVTLVALLVGIRVLWEVGG